MKKFLIIAVFLCGCTPNPVPDLAIEVPHEKDYKADLAWELGEERSIIVPIPIPVPTPIGICLDCNGTGMIDGDHDGIPDYACTTCGGDGRIEEQSIVIPIPVLTTTTEHYIVWEGKEFIWEKKFFVAKDGYKIVMSEGSPETDKYFTMCKGDQCLQVDIKSRLVTK